jgi:hypothetical protein
MRIERVSVAEGQRIASTLTQTRTLDGTYNLVKRPQFDDRYALVPASVGQGEFSAMVGSDHDRGWITLLQNTKEAVVVLGATMAPLD